MYILSSFPCWNAYSQNDLGVRFTCMYLTPYMVNSQLDKNVENGFEPEGILYTKSNFVAKFAHVSEMNLSTNEGKVLGE